MWCGSCWRAAAQRAARAVAASAASWGRGPAVEWAAVRRSGLALLLPAAAPLLPQLPVPAAAPFDFASFMRETGGNTTALFSAIQKADGHLPKGPIHVYSERGGGGARLNILHMLHIIHILHIID